MCVGLFGNSSILRPYFLLFMEHNLDTPSAFRPTQAHLDEIARANHTQEKQAKDRIVRDWLPRYTGMPLEKFGQYILLVNFANYVRMFAQDHNVEVYGVDKPMQAATAENITIINFGIGSPNAGLVVDLLEAIHPKAVLFLGKCGGLKTGKNQIGHLILPIAAIRGEGTSNDYLPPEVPALPAFALQKAVSTTVRDLERDYYTGVVYTTNKRVWEHREDFKQRLREFRCTAIDMETATIFTAAFKNQMPAGALLLVSDMPMTPDGIKTEASDQKVTAGFAELHLAIGVKSLKQLINQGLTVKHLRF